MWGDSVLQSSFLNDSKWIDSKDAVIVAFSFASLSLLISFCHVFRHLKHYTMPQIQVYVIRIIFTCPVYAMTSSAALVMGPYATYAEVIRDVYEALVIYSFLNLILEYSGGETDCVYMIENEPMLKMPCPLCCMKPRARDARLMRFCHRGVLQFIITKPIVALIDVIMLAMGLYFHPVWQIVQAVIYNISYGWALYCLFVFYLATKPIIKHFKPIAKFSTVKAIIFATYYQSMILKITLSTPEKAIRWNDFLLCAEMVLFSLMLVVAFPVKEFIGGIPDRRVLQNVKEVFAVRELFQDVYHNFNPAYRDYALQRSQTEAPGMQSYFPQSLNPVAAQMTERYRGRSKRFAFNSLLRGTKPVRAGLRRSYDGGSRDDAYGSLNSSANNSNSNSRSNSNDMLAAEEGLSPLFEEGGTVADSSSSSSQRSGAVVGESYEEEAGEQPPTSRLGRLKVVKSTHALAPVKSAPNSSRSKQDSAPVWLVELSSVIDRQIDDDESFRPFYSRRFSFSHVDSQPYSGATHSPEYLDSGDNIEPPVVVCVGSPNSVSETLSVAAGDSAFFPDPLPERPEQSAEPQQQLSSPTKRSHSFSTVAERVQDSSPTAAAQFSPVAASPRHEHSVEWSDFV